MTRPRGRRAARPPRRGAAPPGLWELARGSPEARGPRFEQALERALLDPRLRVAIGEPFVGPDGFPYREAREAEERPAALGGVPFPQALELATDEGVGIVLGRRDDPGACVLTFGDLFALRAYGRLAGDPEDEDRDGDAADPSSAEALAVGQDDDGLVGIAPPDQAFLPAYVRHALGEFLRREAGIDRPRALVLVDERECPARSLVVNAFAQSCGGEDALERLLERLRWYLPRTRALTAVGRADWNGLHAVDLA